MNLSNYEGKSNSKENTLKYWISDIKGNFYLKYTLQVDLEYLNSNGIYKKNPDLYQDFGTYQKQLIEDFGKVVNKKQIDIFFEGRNYIYNYLKLKKPSNNLYQDILSQSKEVEKTEVSISSIIDEILLYSNKNIISEYSPEITTFSLLIGSILLIKKITKNKKVINIGNKTVRTKNKGNEKNKKKNNNSIPPNRSYTTKKIGTKVLLIKKEYDKGINKASTFSIIEGKYCCENDQYYILNENGKSSYIIADKKGHFLKNK